MLIVGARGFAKEVLEVVSFAEAIEEIVFYDDVNTYTENLCFGKYPILTSVTEVLNYFKTIDNKFTIGIGNPFLRKKMCDKFTGLEGLLTSTISKDIKMGSHDIAIGQGSNILPGVAISNSVKIGKGCIIYYNSIITHDVTLGDFVEVSPAAVLLGHCSIGAYTQVGANATILPNITIGKNVVIAAGSVVTSNVPDNCMVAGVPAKIKKAHSPLLF